MRLKANVLRSREFGRKLGSSFIKESYDFFDCC